MIWIILFVVVPLAFCFMSRTEEPKMSSEFPRSNRWKIEQIKERMQIRKLNRHYEYYSHPLGIRRLTLVEGKIKERQCSI